VRLLVRAEAEDESNWRKRGHFNGHLTDFLGNTIWEVIFPVRYAEERIFLLGREAIDPLLQIVGNPSEEYRIRETAWRVLVKFDDPRIREEILRQLKAARLKPFDAARLLIAHFPLEHGSRLVLEDAYVLEWLEANKDKTFEEVCLRALDDIMESGEHIRDDIPLRWLNFMYDQDLDRWLAEKAPDALEFRNRELAKGYDPVVCFGRFCDNLAHGIIDQGIKAVFVDPKDQAGCRHVMMAMDISLKSPIRVPCADDWESRVREWYRKHRSELRYDREKHRFVVKVGTSVDGR
jgi:hypothetical protein